MALYLNVSQPMGGALNWSEGERLDEMDGIFAEMIRQINFIVSNLGADNVIEAASVKAENIDTKNAKIVNAQIKNLTASKIKAGTLDLSKGITIQNGNNTRSMTITEDGILITDQTGQEDILRFALLPDENGKFVFMLCNEEGEPTIAMDDDGNAAFRGTVESSEVYSSHIVGTDKDTYGEYTPPEDNNGVFVDIDNKGIKVMQDVTEANGVKNRLQKAGMTSDSEGTAFLVLGAGNNDNVFTMNGVKYSDDMLMISKGKHSVDIVYRGMNSGIQMMPDGIALYAPNVTVNGKPVATKDDIDSLKSRIQALENR